MAKHDDTVVSEHDGIQELDNQLPRWWVLLFQFSIVFAVIYLLWFHVLGFGLGQEERFQVAQEEAEQLQATRTERMMANMDFSVPSTLPDVLAEGETIFLNNCASCHTATGAGLIGPNLTDAYWIHGAEFDDSMHVIAKGVLEKGMQAWENLLSLRQRHAVASYIYSIRGTDPAGAKPPQGDFVEGSDSPTYSL
jgi:cytochrome c oxidase cbb3-type subunit 3